MATDVVGRGGGCRRDENLRKRTKAVCVWDPQSRDPAQVTGLQAKRARQVTSLIGSMSWREFLAESAGRELQSLVNAVVQSLSYSTDLAQHPRLILSSQESLVLSSGITFFELSSRIRAHHSQSWLPTSKERWYVQIFCVSYSCVQ